MDWYMTLVTSQCDPGKCGTKYYEHQKDRRALPAKKLHLYLPARTPESHRIRAGYHYVIEE